MKNKEFIVNLSKQLIEEGNLDVIEAFFSKDYIANAGNKQYQGHGFLNRWTKQIHSAIRNIKVINILILSEEG